MKIFCKALEIPLKGSFKQASHSREMSESIWVEVHRGEQAGYGEGCPRTYVTNESLKDALLWIEKKKARIQIECYNLNRLKAFVINNNSELDKHPAAWCAVELALLDLFAKEASCQVEDLFNISWSSSVFKYTAVLSNDSHSEFLAKIERFKRLGFENYKVKISGDVQRDQQKFENLNRCLKDQKTTLRVDANNLWGENLDEAKWYFDHLNLECVGIEEPFRTGEFQHMAELQKYVNTPIILDESGAKVADLKKAQKTGAHFILNLKVSKAGGIIRSLNLIDIAKAVNMKIIIGAHVGETSVLTRAAMVIARYTGEALIGQEGGFGEYLIEKDKVQPVLQLNNGGAIDLSSFELQPYGWGLTLKN